MKDCALLAFDCSRAVHHPSIVTERLCLTGICLCAVQHSSIIIERLCLAGIFYCRCVIYYQDCVTNNNSHNNNEVLIARLKLSSRLRIVLVTTDIAKNNNTENMTFKKKRFYKVQQIVPDFRSIKRECTFALSGCRDCWFLKK